MKEKYLITGVTGTGKSTVGHELFAMGYESYDIESIPGMFGMYHKGTKKLFEDFDNEDIEKIKNADWLCDTEKLKQLLLEQKNKIAFYSGIASNTEEIIPLFDTVFLLVASPLITYERLLHRHGTGDAGTTEESRQNILGWKDTWEEKMRRNGAVIIDANGDPHEIAENLVHMIA